MKKTEAIAFYRREDEPSDAEAIKRISDALGISRHAVYQWEDEVPELRALQLERATKGKLKAEPRAA